MRAPCVRRALDLFKTKAIGKPPPILAEAWNSGLFVISGQLLFNVQSLSHIYRALAHPIARPNVLILADSGTDQTVQRRFVVE